MLAALQTRRPSSPRCFAAFQGQETDALTDRYVPIQTGLVFSDWTASLLSSTPTRVSLQPQHSTGASRYRVPFDWVASQPSPSISVDGAFFASLRAHYGVPKSPPPPRGQSKSLPGDEKYRIGMSSRPAFHHSTLITRGPLFSCRLQLYGQTRTRGR